MQEIQIQTFEFIKMDKPAAFGIPSAPSPVTFQGRIAVRYVKDDIPRQALVRAQSGWEIHLFEDGDDLYTCAFDGSRNSICIERFRPGDVARVQLLTGAQRASSLGANFATDAPSALVDAAKTGF